MLTQKEIEFIIENATANTSKLLLGAAKYPDVNVKLCVNCIESRQKIVSKLPHWHANDALVYPSPLAAEQCSSEITAAYKKVVISNLLPATPATSTAENSTGFTGADLTGGMGVDTFYLAQLCKTDTTVNGAPVIPFHYFERNSELCRATEYNLRQLGADNIVTHNIEISSNNISQLPGAPFDFIFIDPARRSKTNKSAKVISLQDYEPNIIDLKEKLFGISHVILVKVSPMADIKLNLELLPEIVEIHIVSVDNECKELLFLLESENSCRIRQSHNIPTGNNTRQNGAIEITAVNFSSKGQQPQFFRYTAAQEMHALPTFASELGKYLYEPNKALLKSGAFKLVSQRFGCHKLAQSTHLYTSDNLIKEFPGKIYMVEDTIPFNKKALRQIADKYPQANLSSRNFPLDTNALKKLSGIKDGGNRHLFFTTLGNSKKIAVIASIIK